MAGEAPISDEELRRAYETCSSTPVHTPERIQGCGALLACTLDLTKILRASANTEDVFGIKALDLLGASPADLLTREELHGIRNRLGHPTITTQREVVTSRMFGDQELQIALHKSGGMAILEFIPETLSADQRMRLFEDARSFLTMPMDEEDIDGFLADATERMRAINGFDRVKLYRFLPDGSGEVVAESRMPDMTSYLGLRFPDTDIPRIARELYAKTPFRALHDVHAEDIPILGGEGDAPIDMSFCALRGLDPVHRQYLKNMDVGGTFSVSVVLDGALWGLFACHNRTPRPVDPTMLMAADLAGKLVSLRIQHAMETRRQTAKRACKDIANKFLVVDDSSLAIETYWKRSQTDLQALLPCDGMAIMIGQYISFVGDAPPEKTLQALFSLVAPQTDVPFVADDMPSRLRGANWGKTAGAMAISFGDGGMVKLAFLRNLAASQITWAGAPKKDVIKDDHGIRLDPRHSFETYTQNVEGRCVEWTADDIATGQALLSAFQDVFAVQQELSGNRHRLGLMVRELNHRVRNILALVQSISAYSRDTSTSFAAYTENLEQRIVALAGAHNLLTQVDMVGASLRDVLSFEFGPYAGDQDRVSIEGPDVAFRPEAVSVVVLLIHELTSNAAKHGALSVCEGRVKVTWRKERGGVELNWREVGGPAVAEPKNAGFGRSIIEDAIPYEFKGEASIAFHPDGFAARFWLPGHTLAHDIMEVPKVPTSDLVAAAPALRSGLKGLVVEDNFVVSKVAEQVLRSEGFEHVDRAATVQDALRSLEEKRYDFCLLDVVLQGNISVPVAKDLVNKGMPFVFATGYGNDRHDAVDEFGVPKLTKPLEPEKLRMAIADMSFRGDHE